MTELQCESGSLALACEYPIALWSMMQELTDYDFLIGLTATRDAKYKTLFETERNPDRYRVVDNGIFEDPTHPLTAIELLRIAETLCADEVVPVDIINNANATMDHMWKFLSLSDNFPFQIQGVVQGASLKDWLRCFWTFHDHDRIDVIGITYFEVPPDVLALGMMDAGIPDVHERARLYLLHALFAGVAVDGTGNLVFRTPPSKPIHLLGCRHCAGLKYYRQYPLIRSIDTSFPVQLGMEGQVLHMNSKKPVAKVAFSSTPIRAEVALVAMNVLRFLQICTGTPQETLWEVSDRVAKKFHFQ